MRVSIGLTALMAFLVVAAAPAVADEQSTGPALGVARISVVQGDVATMRGDSGDWIAAAPNMPVVEGDSIQVNTGARAEVQLAYGNFIRLGSDTEVEFLELGGKLFRLRLLEGTVIYSELPDSEADIDIETPLAAVRPMKAGRYIVSVLASATYISVPKGRTDVAFQLTSRILEGGRTMIVRDGPSGTEFETRRGVPDSELDRWAADRDKEARRTISYNYVSRDIYGAHQLDHFGEWRYIAGMGHSWFPYVTVSWTPYRHGRWSWVDYYGWTWVGLEPWGWAPYHWGRWYRHRLYGWGWYPGAPGLRHVWRPALVTFFGFGSLGGSAGSIGWCPLAPGEVYRPWYGRRYYSGGLPQSIVVDNSVRVYNRYRNAREDSGVSYLEARSFGGGARQVPRALRTAELGDPVAIRGPLPIVPERASQGRLLGTRSADGAGSALKTLRRPGPSTLRDGTARVPFDTQRNQIQTSVAQFRRTYRPAAASTGSNSVAGSSASSSVIRAPSGASSLPAQARRSPSAGVGALSTSRSAARASITPAPRVPSSPGNAARTLGTSTRESSTLYVPRARSRIGAAVQPPAGGGLATAARSQSRRAPVQLSRPSTTERAPSGAPTLRRQGSSRPSFGARSAPRPPGTSTPSRATVYTPRNRSRIGTPGSPGSTSRRTTERAASVYAPRTSSRASMRSRPSAPSSRNSGPSYFPGSSRNRSASSNGGGGYRGSSYPSSRSSSRSRSYGSYGGGSSRGSYSTSSGRSSSSSRSYGGSSAGASRPSSSRGSFGGSRPSGGGSSVSRSSGGSRSYGGGSSSSSSSRPAAR